MVPTARRAVANVLELQALPWKAWGQQNGGGSEHGSKSRKIEPSGLLEVPLIDGHLSLSWQLRDVVSEMEIRHRSLQPLPSAHLPRELTTPHVYAMDVSWPLYRHVVRYARDVASRVPGSLPLVGHVAHKPNADTWVGAIGCTAEIRTKEKDEGGLVETTVGTSLSTVACRGHRRFVVSQVLQTIPYPVALVEELLDTEPGETGYAAELVDVDEESDDESDDEDTDSDPIDALDASELVPLLVRAVNEYTELLLDSHVVRGSIVGPPGGGGQAEPKVDLSAYRYALDAAAVWEAFQSSLIDVAPLPRDRYYTVAMLAAEVVDLDAATRRKCLVWTDGTARLRLVLKKVRRAVGLQRARCAVKSITDASDEKGKDLLVRVPFLPPWAKQIKRHTHLEYYWNEKHGWCKAIVADDPILVADELLVTVYFADDGTTHRLAFSAVEKVRWRPARPTPPTQS